jgi:hypothetical protein
MLILAVGCLILTLSCGLGVAAVRQGSITPPDMSLQLGGVRLVGITSRFPDCTQLIALGCIRLRQAPIARVYTLWLFVQNEPNSWNRPYISKLLALQVGE